MNNRNPVASTPAAARTEAAEGGDSLKSQLAAYREQSRQRLPEFARVYDELIARLAILDRGEVGPKIGEQMPNFILPDEAGRLVSLSSLLKTGPVVISLNRGHWCPYCKLELRALAAVHDQIERLGARVVSIMPDNAQFTSGYAKESQLPFPILSDIDLGYSLSLGLIFWVGDEIKRMYEDIGIELEKYHGNQASFLPMAGKFIVGADGQVKERQVNIEFRERMEPAAVVAALRKLKA